MVIEFFRDFSGYSRDSRFRVNYFSEFFLKNSWSFFTFLWVSSSFIFQHRSGFFRDFWDSSRVTFWDFFDNFQELFFRFFVSFEDFLVQNLFEPFRCLLENCLDFLRDASDFFEIIRDRIRILKLFQVFKIFSILGF